MVFLGTFSVQPTKFWTQPRPSLWKLSRISVYSTLSHKVLDVIGCYLTNYWMSYVSVIVGYITNFDMSFYVILHFTGHHCVLSQTTGFHCMLSHKLLGILYVISQNSGCHCLLSHKLLDAFVTNYWTSLYVISQTAGCHCLLPHKLLDVLFYFTNCWMLL